MARARASAWLRVTGCGSVDVAAAELDFDRTLDLEVFGVAVDHGPVRPAHDPHQVAFLGAPIEEVVGERVPPLMLVGRVPVSLLRTPDDHAGHAAARESALPAE